MAEDLDGWRPDRVETGVKGKEAIRKSQKETRRCELVDGGRSMSKISANVVLQSSEENLLQKTTRAERRRGTSGDSDGVSLGDSHSNKKEYQRYLSVLDSEGQQVDG